MSLSKTTTGLLQRHIVSFVARRAGSGTFGATPQKAARQLIVPASESGFFKYERDFSRDSRYSQPQKLGDTPKR